MKARLASFSLLAAVLAAAPARAATFYVATTGNDAYPGSVDLPFRTVGKGVSALRAAGDILYIRAGTYASAIYPAVSGTAAAWITISAYPGELPILDGAGLSVGGSGVEPTSVAVQYVRVVGLASRNWPSSGLSNGFNFPSSHVEFRNCIADGNGINGIAFYKATGVLIQNNIVLHNGNQLPSFSSGVNLFTAGGTFQDNVVRGNVSFENVDISSNHSDGSGFILDENSTGALFDGNIAFGNGGSCIRLTNSSGSHLVNNTCYHNGVDPANAFTVHEIFFSDNTSRTNVLASNNLTAAIAGRMGFSQTTGTGSTFRNNLQINLNGATPFFMNPAGVDFRLVAGSTTVIDQGNSGDAGPNDIGFDPRCVRQQSGQAVARWQYAVDYTYVASVGGVAGCFRPGPRIQGAAPDLGAYEAGNPIGTGAGGAAGGMGGAGGSGGLGGGSGGSGAGGSTGSGGRGGAGGTSGGAGGTSSGAGGTSSGAGGNGTASGAGGTSSGSGGIATGDTGGAPAAERGAAAGCGCATTAPVRQDSFGLLGAIVLGVGLLLGTKSRARRAASGRRPSPARRTSPGLLVAGALAACGAAFSACIIHPGATTVAGAPVPASQVAPLRQAAAAAQRRVGVALMSHRLDDQRVRALVAAHFDSLTPENEMKWGSIEPQPARFSFTAGDKLVAFAAESGIRVRGHTLVWHNQLPPWVKGLTGPALQAAVANHVQGVVGHFKGKVAAWDVVNEAFANGPSGELRSESPFTALGPSFIDEAFRLAHQADPAAQLFYNDYEIEGEGTPKAEAVFQLCKRLKETGVPIDGVGMQMHVDPRNWPPADSIRRNMERFAALGLRVEITEMDVPVGEIPGTVAEKLAQQRIIAHDIVAACIAVPQCAGVTFWGLTDRDSWLSSTEWGALRGRLPHYPLLFDGDYRPKPIVVGVLDAFAGR